MSTPMAGVGDDSQELVCEIVSSPTICIIEESNEFELEGNIDGSSVQIITLRHVGIDLGDDTEHHVSPMDVSEEDVVVVDQNTESDSTEPYFDDDQEEKSHILKDKNDNTSCDEDDFEEMDNNESQILPNFKRENGEVIEMCDDDNDHKFADVNTSVPMLGNNNLKRSIPVVYKRTNDRINTAEANTECNPDTNTIQTQHAIKEFKCAICPKAFSVQRSLYRHVRNVHKMEPRTGTKHCPFSSCKNSFYQLSAIWEHVSLVHHVNLQRVRLSFNSNEEFMKWKTQEECSTNSIFIANTGPRNLCGTVKRYFICQRSGNYTPRGRGKRAMKLERSVRAGVCCPASIIWESKDGEKVNIIYCKTHLGHDSNVKITMDLEEDEKNQIEGVLSQGMSLDQVLDPIREGESRDTSGERGSLISRISAVLNKGVTLVTIPTGCDLADTTVIDLHSWIQEVVNLGSLSPVLYFKEKGLSDIEGKLQVDDFLLVIVTPSQRQIFENLVGGGRVCIDCHQAEESELEDEDDNLYHLTSLLLVDEFGCSCPVAFCLSTRIDQDIMEVFFCSIAKQLGVIDASVFMSDDTKCFYSAWFTVMGKCNIRLLSPWAVDSCWRNMIKKHLRDKPILAVAAYRSFRILMEEKDGKAFAQLQRRTIRTLESNKHTKELASDFAHLFLIRPRMWAWSQFYQDIMAGGEMHLEGLHVAIGKHVYNPTNLEQCVTNVLRLTRDKILEKLIRFFSRKVGRKVEMIKIRHTQSCMITLKNIVVVSEGKEWTVKDSNDFVKNVVSYIDTTKPFNMEKCPKSCKLRCTTCFVCVHQLSCTCMDYAGRHNPCKHIHAVATFQKRYPTIRSRIESKFDIMLEYLSVPHVTSENIRELEMDVDSWIEKLMNQNKRPTVISMKQPVKDHIENITITIPKPSEKKLTPKVIEKVNEKRKILPKPLVIKEEISSKLCHIEMVQRPKSPVMVYIPNHGSNGQGALVRM